MSFETVLLCKNLKFQAKNLNHLLRNLNVTKIQEKIVNDSDNNLNEWQARLMSFQKKKKKKIKPTCLRTSPTSKLRLALRKWSFTV